ncbi:MAG: HNH endonuclease [bacterium]|nr:HNH endonuclease [bacterium]
MKKNKLPLDFIRKCESVTAKRPKTVIDHIIKFGYITTEELKEKYGYNHPPRAARDVREHGIPLDTFRVVGKDQRKVAAYRFGDPRKARFSKLTGRTAFAKDLKSKLIALNGPRCMIYHEEFDERYLQIDHRVPFEVAGDNLDRADDSGTYMLLCGSANRAKAWSCQHCINWLELNESEVCRKCYWAYPADYDHIAMVQCRRLDIMWLGDEVTFYDRLKKRSLELQKDLPKFVKEIIEKLV